VSLVGGGTPLRRPVMGSTHVFALVGWMTSSRLPVAPD
jgi:hypothetical protein